MIPEAGQVSAAWEFMWLKVLEIVVPQLTHLDTEYTFTVHIFPLDVWLLLSSKKYDKTGLLQQDTSLGSCSRFSRILTRF